jgi:hypothetical protein
MGKISCPWSVTGGQESQAIQDDFGQPEINGHFP